MRGKVTLPVWKRAPKLEAHGLGVLAPGVVLTQSPAGMERQARPDARGGEDPHPRRPAAPACPPRGPPGLGRADRGWGCVSWLRCPVPSC